MALFTPCLQGLGAGGTRMAGKEGTDVLVKLELTANLRPWRLQAGPVDLQSLAQGASLRMRQQIAQRMVEPKAWRSVLDKKAPQGRIEPPTRGDHGGACQNRGHSLAGGPGGSGALGRPGVARQMGKDPWRKFLLAARCAQEHITVLRL